MDLVLILHFNYMKKYLYFIVFTVTTIFFSCETFELDQLENPSNINVSKRDVELSFNYIQLQLPQYVNALNGFTQRVTRQMAMTGGNTYDNAFEPASFSGNWFLGFDILNNIKFFEPKATAVEDYVGLGAARIIRCYVYITLVDMYGDIPYDEALLGNVNLTPKYDKGSYIYGKIYQELSDALVTIDTPTDQISAINDIYFGGDKSKWIKLANTLKLKMLITGRLATFEFGVADAKSEIENILASGKYINDTADDFQFNYGDTRLNPNSRHPQYNDQYETGGGAYIANYMFWTMTTEKGVSLSTGNFHNQSLTGVTGVFDPRTAFYFHKQENPTTTTTNPFNLPNRIRPEHYNDSKYNSYFFSQFRTSFTLSNWTGGALASNGYWGRDHGNGSGVPPDNNLRTCTGLYPIGGELSFSDGDVQTNGSKGAKGAGIMPIMLASYVKFLKAEAILKLGVAGDAKQELLDAVAASINKTVNFIPSYSRPKISDPLNPGQMIVNPSYAFGGPNGLDAKRDAYLNFIGSTYTSSSNDNKKLELIMKEYFIAAWGNGIETYNNYRRTGFPSNFQPTLEPISGAYYYTALYPANAVDNNPNTPLNDRTRRVFWDKANLNLE
jgi:Starch-binding associating with outer membrane/Susd and RagB outer membrane lipoprotein